MSRLLVIWPTVKLALAMTAGAWAVSVLALEVMALLPKPKQPSLTAALVALNGAVRRVR